ncbi:MAG: hypothetical protein IJ797_01095 [Selenomonadaceae bacterium]|nr:hypothetical protein [Selenomonadaceae bacterium]
MIHICYGLYDKNGHYSKFVGTSILSVFENTQSDVTVHILHDNTLNSDNRDKFIYLAGRYNQQVKFYNVESMAFNKIESIKQYFSNALTSKYSIATMYRLLISDILPKNIGKAIYLDADIIVNRNINDLWSIDISNYPIAAFPEINTGVNHFLDKYVIDCGMVEIKDYFNAGVLLINLEYCRNNQNLIDEGINFIYSHPECKYFDQDILNYCFSKNYFKLSNDFNIYVPIERINNRPNKICCAIYHYVSHSLQFDISDIFNRLYFEYFVKTPWFNMDMISNIFNSVRNMYNNNKNLLMQTTRLISGKKRAFFMEEQNVAALKMMCGIKDDEQIILAVKMPDSINELIQFLLKSQKQVIVFVFVGNYKFIHDILIQCKLSENVDFINGNLFLPEQPIIPFNSHFIVRDM